MGASPAQVASAKALAKSRGYNPNLVDEDNADRVNTAFPAGGDPNHGPNKPQGAKGASTKPAAVSTPPLGAMAGQVIPTVAPPQAAPSSAPMAGLSAATPSLGGGGSQPSLNGLSSPLAGGGPAPMTNLGGGEAEVSSLGGEGNIRGNLGQRIYPQQSAALAGLRRVY